MYEELVKRLRDDEAWKNCDFDFIYGWMHEAADAIEEMSRLHEAQRQNLITLMNEEPEPKWIPVTERLPEPKFAREWYLVVLESGCVKTLAFEKQGRSDNLFRPGWHETASPVTHWMPLPEPPKEDE